jgi:3-polyprenyl-4-hydroxybenzoate decarboxylase
VGEILFRNGRPAIIAHNAILVDERIDIYNFDDVVWAFATRSRPNMQQTFFEEVPAYPLVPFMSHGPVPNAEEGGKVVTDCLFPYQYKLEAGADKLTEYEICDFKNGFSQQIQDKVPTFPLPLPLSSSLLPPTIT